ncbi:hypothetical protein QQF64_025707 [Cirrhinus molitorella]|uniref:TLDc domain-containing protein n=1 Tax=Cirrhinus molitorella TaxID=172907 RepID=A0ABR3NQ36_9TELE
MSDSSRGSSASTVIIDEVPNKKQRTGEAYALSAKQVEQDFTLLFDEETSSRLLQKWDTFFRPNVIKEAKSLTSTAELSELLLSAERPQGSDLDETRSLYDQEMSSLLLLVHLLPPPNPEDRSLQKLVHVMLSKDLLSFISLDEHLNNNQRQHPYLLAVGRQKSKIDSFYITLDKHLIPCKANRSLGAFDELFKAHFVFNLSYDGALPVGMSAIVSSEFVVVGETGSLTETPIQGGCRPGARQIYGPRQFYGPGSFTPLLFLMHPVGGG